MAVRRDTWIILGLLLSGVTFLWQGQRATRNDLSERLTKLEETVSKVDGRLGSIEKDMAGAKADLEWLTGKRRIAPAADTHKQP